MSKIIKNVYNFFIISILLILFILPVTLFADTSQCAECHTNPVKLIRITREYAQELAPLQSPEQEGEG